MIKAPLISIVVPVYNVEDYLAQCVDSILNQSYTNFELLLVDDGSTDKSGSLCDEYALKDSRIVVYHKENGGLSDARNYGIDRIKGEYITFIDSDDYVGSMYLEILYDLIEQFGAEASSIAHIDFIDGDTREVFESKEPYYVTDKKGALRFQLLKTHFGVSAWGKLYRSNLFVSIRYPKGYPYEDLYTTPYVLMNCEKIAYSDSVQHYYRVRPISISHGKITDRDYTVLEGQQKLYDFTVEHYPDMKLEANRRFVDDLIMVLFQRMIYLEDYASRINALKKQYFKMILRGAFNKYLGINRRIQALLILLSPRLYKYVYLQSLKRKRA